MHKRRKLGQHYLVDPTVVELMIKTAAIRKGERVLEIGTGKAALTKRLCELSDNVEAFEIDETNYRITRALLDKGLDLHLGDAFSASPTFDVLVSSLPYSESSKFVEWLSQKEYDRAIVILQKDFVEKLTSQPHDRRYRAISVIFQMSSNIKVVGEVGRASFAPPPRVSSVVALIKPVATLTPQRIRFVDTLFSQKKKRLRAALKRLDFEGKKIGAEKLSKRVWELSPIEIRDLAERLA